jgi:hypothetical protein
MGREHAALADWSDLFTTAQKARTGRGKKLPPGAFLVPPAAELGYAKDAATAPRSLTPAPIGFHCRQMLETMP